MRGAVRKGQMREKQKARQTAVCGMQMAGVENAEDYILQVAPIENLTGGAITF